jgi:hypothetical protein
MKTDESIIKEINATYAGSPQAFKEAMLGIYQTRRDIGDEPLDAYIYTLRCHVDPTHSSLRKLPTP